MKRHKKKEAFELYIIITKLKIKRKSIEEDNKDDCRRLEGFPFIRLFQYPVIIFLYVIITHTKSTLSV